MYNIYYISSSILLSNCYTSGRASIHVAWSTQQVTRGLSHHFVQCHQKGGKKAGTLHETNKNTTHVFACLYYRVEVQAAVIFSCTYDPVACCQERLSWFPRQKFGVLLCSVWSVLVFFFYYNFQSITICLFTHIFLVIFVGVMGERASYVCMCSNIPSIN